MLIRFTIEERHLTDLNGKVASHDVSFHSCEAASVEEAVRLYVASDTGAEVIGKVQTFPGFQGVATVRRPTGVYTLAISPSSQQLTLK